jgi:glycosyltransferase involved in cell wall biosynthesis
MRALFFGTYDTGSHPRVGVLIEGLREHGIAVTECNAPLGLSTADRVKLLQRPWRLPLLAVRLAARWAQLVRCARRLPRPDVVVVGYLGHFDVRLARLLFRTTTIALDHLIGASDTATDRGVGGGPRQRLLRGLDAGALAAADIVVVDTDEHLQALPEEQRAKAVVVAVGAPSTWFAEPLEREDAPEPPDLAPLRVVFFGLYTPLQGGPVIGTALALLAGDPAARTDVTMIGTGQDLLETRRLAKDNPSVTWQDWVPPSELPPLVAAHDVCLGIFGTSPKAVRVVPNKVFQGAAAGCAIVTSDTEPQRRIFGPAAIYVPPGDAPALAGALRDLARDRDLLRGARSASRMLAQAAFTPAAVTAPLAQRFETLMSEVRS